MTFSLTANWVINNFNLLENHFCTLSIFEARHLEEGAKYPNSSYVRLRWAGDAGGEGLNRREIVTRDDAHILNPTRRYHLYVN